MNENPRGDYAEVNDLRMYYEVHVGGAPVPLHLGDDHPPVLRQAPQERPHIVGRHVGPMQ